MSEAATPQGAVKDIPLLKIIFFWVPLFVLSVPSFLSSPPYFFFVSLFVLFVRPKEITRFFTQTGWAVYYPKENKASYITSVNGPLFFAIRHLVLHTSSY